MARSIWIERYTFRARISFIFGRAQVIPIEMPDDFGISSLPQMKKVSAVIPTRLYSELQSHGMFNETWDAWLAEAILDKLRKEKKLEVG